MRRSAVLTAGTILALAGCGSVAGPTTAPAKSATSSPTATVTQPASPTATAVPAAPSMLVFNTFHGSTSDAVGVTTFRQLDGTIIASVTSQRSDSTFDLSATNSDGYIGYSHELLSSDQLAPPGGAVSVTTWGFLEKDGSAHPAAPSLTTFLNETWQTGEARVGPGIFVVDPGTLFAAEATSSGPINYKRVNLATGDVTTLFTARALPSAQPFSFITENISPSGDTISFLAANAMVMNQVVNGLAVVTFDVPTSALVVHPLPPVIATEFLPRPGATAWEPTVFASADGSLVVYQTSVVVNGSNAFTTHVYDTLSGQEVAVAASAPISFVPGENSVFFSPDDTYTALAGMTPSGGDDLVVAATATGAIVKAIGVPDDTTHSVTPMGWTSSGALIFVTNTATTPGNFNPDNAVTHSLDPATGTVHDYPAGWGELAAVLY